MDDKELDDILSQMIEQEKKESDNTTNQSIEDIKFPDLSQIYYDLTKQINQIDKSSDDKNLNGLEETLISMLRPFLSKDVLYEPIKELKEQFPEWLEKNKTIITSEEFEKRIKQYETVCKIVELFEQSTEPPMEIVVDLIQKMGQPPHGLAQYLAE
ncbi:peroxisomal biogenesis factor, putative [Entamoeba dispar SAW760]|uniref:Peroxisomal biogenesis factor, putative n=1 Tax=Entamoeba dispar (strain ATCC PRA-260 / SAW760) TaxID=370354 RepID=B0EEW6_ENTDS|nr:peroxisomal biogenesis factor, putative [Entamoeba dispar SAW760]EDR26926.1 peroxisomal biogenesis factor, putative [Entamoeba dispar SAW760]|eukprot:EDR26926.1 peroxisomal biogenesis factor, putative [Entamoeba dispar SAW760]